MRGRLRDRQETWFTARTRDDSGIDTVYNYSTPVMKRVTVSPTAGTPEELAVGIVPEYDRVIVCYDRGFHPTEGTAVYVDRTPELDGNGELVIGADGEPTVLPDYRVKRVMTTQKGHISRFGLVKNDAND